MNILYTDDRVIVCVKPQGVLSTDEPGGMPELLRAALGDTGAVIKSVHRLDRVTGGVMVYARTRRAAADLSSQMADDTFHKTYLAVVCGVPYPAEGQMHDWLHRDPALHRSFVVPAGTAQAQEALLSYRVLRQREGRSLAEIDLHTGRTHQIRCQFAARGLPLAGDAKYGEADGSPLGLWAVRLRFRHPRDGREMCFEALPPEAAPWF